jgi:hypothetical protein
MKKSVLRLALAALPLMALFSSCTNGPGPGGKSSITGRLHATNVWNSNCAPITNGDEYFVPDEEVYIVYGDEAAYGDRVRTGPDGTFMFRYLRVGTYKVYAYSNDCAEPSGKSAVIMTVDVTEKNQEIDLGTLEIEK